MIDQTSNRKNKLEELKQEFDELDVRDRLETLLEFSDELPDLPQRYRLFEITKASKFVVRFKSCRQFRRKSFQHIYIRRIAPIGWRCARLKLITQFIRNQHFVS